MIIAVDLSAKLFLWNALDHTFVQLGTEVSDVFTDSGRDVISLAVQLMGSTRPGVLHHIRTQT